MCHSRKVRCECGWEGSDDDVKLVTVFHQTRYEPEENEAFCPECGNPADDSITDVPLCKVCEDEYVKDEGDVCPECNECMKEDKYDAMADDGPYGRIS